ncbi:MAG: methionine synthase [Chloroflexi bacterium]|nr:methionine synthase [Chloroflexota bacterium]
MTGTPDFGCLPTIIGSMPHTDPQAACRLIGRFLKDIPVWPQLPNRSAEENMYAQFGQGFPGIVMADGRITIDRSRDLELGLERLYTAHASNAYADYPIGPDHAAGLQAFLNLDLATPLAVKGQVTGPISWGLCVTDGVHYAVYDDSLADAMARHLRLKAAWQESVLRRLSPNVILFVDEPYLTSLGSAFVSLPSEKVVALLTETLGGIAGIRGLHCCGNTDWTLLLDLPIHILSFDAYNYAGALSTYPEQVQSFLKRGGTVAWGIVPNDEEALARESVASLKDRLEEAMAPYARSGTPFKRLLQQALLTPSCGLASLSAEAAEHCLEFLAQLSARMRQQHAL